MTRPTRVELVSCLTSCVVLAGNGAAQGVYSVAQVERAGEVVIALGGYQFPGRGIGSRFKGRPGGNGRAVQDPPCATLAGLERSVRA